MRLTVVLAAALLLGACNSSQTGLWYVPDPPGYAQRKADQAKCVGYGYAQGRLVTACVNELAEQRRQFDRQAEIAAIDDAECRGRGLALGTSPYAECRSAIAQAREERLRALMGPPPVRLTTTCTRLGDTFYCQ